MSFGADSVVILSSDDEESQVARLRRPERKRKQRPPPPLFPPLERFLPSIPPKDANGVCKRIPVCNDPQAGAVCVMLQQDKFCLLHASSNALGESLGTPEGTTRGVYAMIAASDVDHWRANVAACLDRQGNFDSTTFTRYLHTVGVELIAIGTADSLAHFLALVGGKEDVAAVVATSGGHARALRRQGGGWLALESLRGGKARVLRTEVDWLQAMGSGAHTMFSIRRFAPHPVDVPAPREL
jgi:hypothetical protein